jgi:ribonuclease E
MPASAEQPGTAETAPAGVSEQPRKAGWWSRRFGGGE